MKTLELEKHGLNFVLPDRIPSISLSAKDGPLTLTGAYGEGLVGASVTEQAAWKELRAQLFRYAGILKPFLSRRPPDLGGGNSLSETFALGQTALALKRLGKEDMRDFLRVILMNVADLLDEQLTDNRLKGLVAFDAVLGSHLGPRSPTSLLGLYYRLAGEVGGQPGAQLVPKGGMGEIVAAIAASAAKAGVNVRTEAVVNKIRVENGRAISVVLENAEEITAHTIVSAADPFTTFLHMVGPRELDTGFVRKVKNIRNHGDAAKLHLALDRPPRFSGVDDAGHRGRLGHRALDRPCRARLQPVEIRRVFARTRTGGYAPFASPTLRSHPTAPAFCLRLSSMRPTSCARAGSAASRNSSRQSWICWNDTRPASARARVMSSCSPLLDIEQRYRMPGGHWHHGELQADQMLMSRPVFGAEGYSTPIDGLFLCGAGSHPGGGVSGAPGLNAARRILAMKG